MYENGDEMETQISLDYALLLFLYATIIVILLMLIGVIVKLMREHEGVEVERASENNSLLLSSSKEENNLCSSYGTTSEEDLESGKGSNCISSSKDLYDGQICVICYDDKRNCLFIPCGHCVTCYTCTKRIISEQIKMCPICRTRINKVKKLRIL